MLGSYIFHDRKALRLEKAVKEYFELVHVNSYFNFHVLTLINSSTLKFGLVRHLE